jgi:hypothetical protein
LCNIAIDDCARLAYAEVLGDKKARLAFLVRAVGCFERHDMSVRQLLTDNGSRYLDGPRDRLPRARHPPPAPPPIDPDEWQGREIHPHHARRLGGAIYRPRNR